MIQTLYAHVNKRKKIVNSILPDSLNQKLNVQVQGGFGPAEGVVYVFIFLQTIVIPARVVNISSG
jgi:hypothetical protein